MLQWPKVHPQQVRRQTGQVSLVQSWLEDLPPTMFCALNPRIAVQVLRCPPLSAACPHSAICACPLLFACIHSTRQSVDATIQAFKTSLHISTSASAAVPQIQRTWAVGQLTLADAEWELLPEMGLAFFALKNRFPGSALVHAALQTPVPDCMPAMLPQGQPQLIISQIKISLKNMQLYQVRDCLLIKPASM